nr:hypothetical protein Iba_scaffold259CG0030 [Ipomoea batatas]
MSTARKLSYLLDGIVRGRSRSSPSVKQRRGEAALAITFLRQAASREHSSTADPTAAAYSGVRHLPPLGKQLRQTPLFFPALFREAPASLVFRPTRRRSSAKGTAAASALWLVPASLDDGNGWLGYGAPMADQPQDSVGASASAARRRRQRRMGFGSSIPSPPCPLFRDGEGRPAVRAAASSVSGDEQQSSAVATAAGSALAVVSSDLQQRHCGRTPAVELCGAAALEQLING